MRRWVIVIFAIGAFFVFQNCQNPVQDPGLFIEDPSVSKNSQGEDCVSGICNDPAELLWLKIKNGNPYRVNLFYNTSGHFNVGGTCSPGLYERHFLQWTMTSLTNERIVEARGTLDDGCVAGRFNISVESLTGGFLEGNRYELEVEIIGENSTTGALITNPLRSSQSKIDVILFREDLSPPIEEEEEEE